MEDWNMVAMDNYEATALLIEEGRWRSAVSRAYYAVYARISAALARLGVQMPAGREGPSHTRLPDLVVDQLKRLSKSLRWRVAGMVRGLYNRRLSADYRPSVRIGNAQARGAANAMTEVFRLC
jgi:uncharacterized protein (UPF0332 family)